MFFGFFRFVLSGVCFRLVKFVQEVEMDFPVSACVALSLVSVCLCVSWVGWKCWFGRFSSWMFGFWYLENFRKVLSRWQEGFRSEFWVFSVFSCFALSGLSCRVVEVVQNVETGFPLCALCCVWFPFVFV